MVRVLFVCLGNICRSPTAEGVMAKLLAAEELSDAVEIDSAGTGGYHAGELADPGARRAASRRGITLTHRARQVEARDFSRFDYLIAMDRQNLAGLERAAPPRATARLALFRSFDPTAPPGAEVPDPYGGDDGDFDEVLDICERACRGLLAHLVSTHGLAGRACSPKR